MVNKFAETLSPHREKLVEKLRTIELTKPKAREIVRIYAEVFAPRFTLWMATGMHIAFMSNDI